MNNLKIKQGGKQEMYYFTLNSSLIGIFYQVERGQEGKLVKFWEEVKEEESNCLKIGET